MATFYVGKRPVLRGRSDKDFANQDKTHTLSGVARSAVGVYSFYPNFGPGLLTGAPDNNHVMGTGYSPHDIFMTRRYRGLDTLNPLDAPGSGARLTGFRFHPFEFKGLPSAKALGSAGHLPKRGVAYEEYDNYTFDGVPSTEPIKNPGHAIRYVSKGGAAFSFGAFGPDENKGVTAQALAGATQTVPAGFNNPYGHNRVMEWHGTPSSKAL